MRLSPELRAIHFRSTTITKNCASIIGKVLSDFKHVAELDVRQCNIGMDAAKEIADGLMRAKQLQVLKIANNGGMGQGVTSILYNLAFSPKISFIDVSDINLQNIGAQVSEALYKLIKISGSIEVLKLDNTNINNYLQEDFFKSLGESKTMRVLSISQPLKMNTNHAQWLGKAIGMNAKKKGSLEVVDLRRSVNSYNDINSIFSSMHISDYDEEMWYGDRTVASKMSGQQLNRRYYCDIHSFFMSGIGYFGSGFNLAYLKKLTHPTWPAIIHMFQMNLTVVDLKQCNINTKNDFELLGECLRNPVSHSRVRVLNLAKNFFRKEGAKILAAALEENKSLEVLDFSGNRIGVSGTKAMAHMLTKNSSLKVLNLFSNTVDVDGARALRDALLQNETLESLDVGIQLPLPSFWW